MNKIAYFVPKVLAGAALGAAGGALIAPKGERTSSALQGAFWGGIAGGPGSAAGSGLKAKIKQGQRFAPTFMSKLRTTPWREPVVGAGLVTGITAATNKLTGAYDPNKQGQHRILRAIAPAADDLAMLGLTLLRAK